MTRPLGAACIGLALLLAAPIHSLAAGSALKGAELIQQIEIKVDPGAFRGPGAWPLGAGVPLPKGRFKSVDGLRLRSGKRGLIPVQITQKNRWPDGSVKWVWLDFQGDPKDRYVLELQARGTPMPTPEPPLRVVQDEKQIGVETGRMRVVWDRRLATPVKVELGKRTISGDGLGVFATDNQGRRSFLGGDGAELEWKVEARGPIRAVIRVEGWYVTKKGDRIARAVVRYHLYSDRTFFFTDHTFVLTEDTNKRWFKEVAVRLPWQAKGPVQARFGVQGEEAAVAALRNGNDQAWIFQDDYPHFAKKRKHFAAGVGSRIVREGEVAAGWCEATDTKGGIVLAVRRFAPQFPKELAVDAEGATAFLWSNRGGKELDYRPATLMKDYYGEDWVAHSFTPIPGHAGEQTAISPEEFAKLGTSALGTARTHELFCAYLPSRSSGPASERWCAAFETPPVGLADPQWLCRSGAFWRIAPKDAKRFPEAEKLISTYFDNWLGRMEEFPMTGWISWGVGPEFSYFRDKKNGKVYAAWYRLGNRDWYNTSRHVWAAYMRSGERKYLEYAERALQFIAHHKVVAWAPGGSGYTRGGVRIGTNQYPFYWSGGGSLETNGASQDFITPLSLGYLLRDKRWAKDAAELYAGAVHRRWTLKKCRTFYAPHTTLNMMIAAYRVTQDPSLAEKIHILADALIDPEALWGLNQGFYTDPASVHGTLRHYYGSTSSEWVRVKPDHKFIAVIDYYDVFGVEKAKQALLKVAEDRFGDMCRRAPFSYQNLSHVLMMRAYHWTGHDYYRAMCVSQMQTAMLLMKEAGYRRLTPEESAGIYGLDKQGFPFFGVPHILAGLRDPEEKVDTFPYLAHAGMESECPLYLQKEAGKEVRLLLTSTDEDATRKGKHMFSVTGPDGRQAAGATVDSRAVFIPASCRAGTYRVSLDHHRFIVIGCNAGRIVLSCPEGTYFGHSRNIGYEITRGKRYYFLVPRGRDSFSLRVSYPIRVFDPSGAEIASVRDQTGRLTVRTEGRYGLWSFLPGRITFLRFEDLDPVVAFGNPDRFFVPRGIPKAKPEPRWEPPAEEGLTSGRFGAGLHLKRKAYKAKWGHVAGAKDFPFPEGTIECFVRTDWSSRWSPDLGSTLKLWEAPPLQFGYVHQPFWTGMGGAYIRGFFGTGVAFMPYERKVYFPHLSARGYASFRAGEWNHFACTWRLDPPRYAVWRNGVKLGELTKPGKQGAADGSLSLGLYNATYDELRVSRVVRYKENFSPPTQPFVEDRDTVLLFHFDNNLRYSTRGPIVEFEPR